MSETSLQIEKAAEHNYLVRVIENGDAVEDEVEFVIRCTPQMLTRLGYEPAHESQVVAATAAFLIRRQLAADLPDVGDLDDVEAVYDDYL